MTPPELVALFLNPLNTTGVRYIVTGSVAAAIYGEPRFTQDIDLVVRLASENLRPLIAAFPAAEYYVPPLETLAEEAGRPSGGHFNLLHLDTGLRADCYLAGSSPLNHWGLENRREIPIGPDRISVAPPEYVILSKLQYVKAGGGEKHLDDIAHMLRITGDGIDRSEVVGWAQRLGLLSEWRAALDRPIG